jgi:hypothetical protein
LSIALYLYIIAAAVSSAIAKATIPYIAKGS